MKPALLTAESVDALSDEEIVERVRAGELELFEALMRRYNQRLYRVTRSVLRDAGESEDVVQDAWVRAFTHLDQFAGRARFSTWLTRIAVYEAWGRARRRSRFESIDADSNEKNVNETSRARNPEEDASNSELASILEGAIETLPESYRTVFVLREVESLSTEETAECLDLTGQTVKTRLHRARSLLRRDLADRVGPSAARAYAFAGARCDRIVASVLARIRALENSPARNARAE
jgi:RNA polymerase sigma-70 factor (ECF subfamily)